MKHFDSKSYYGRPPWNISLDNNPIDAKGILAALALYTEKFQTRSSFSFQSAQRYNLRVLENYLLYFIENHGFSISLNVTDFYFTQNARNKLFQMIHPTSTRVFENRYKILPEFLGNGSYGQIRAVADLNTHSTDALKTTSLIDYNYLDNIAELAVWKYLPDNKNLAPLKNAFLFDNSLYLVTKKATMSLFDYLYPDKSVSFDKQKPSDIPIEKTKRWMKEILNGIKALHDGGIIHGDIKAENILLDENEKLMITDFGHAEIAETSQRSNIGSPFYRAPEIEYGKPHSQAIDIWSFGIIVLELHGYSLIKDKFINERYRSLIPPEVDRLLIDLLSRCFCDENVRISAQNLLQHAYLK